VATLDEWTVETSQALGLPGTDLDPTLVLDLARQVAHEVARPAAPLTAYLVGVAVGRGMAAAEAVLVVTELVRRWATRPADGD
jgi:uncharacterized protein DUF6457